MDLKDLENELNQMGLLVSKIEEWAEKIPNKTFFYYGEEDRHLTYKEFNQMANRLAHNLRAMGVNKGDRVSLVFVQSSDNHSGHVWLVEDWGGLLPNQFSLQGTPPFLSNQRHETQTPHH